MEYQTEQHGDPDRILTSKLEREKADRKRALTTAIVFGVIILLALASLVYGYVQKGIADEKIKSAQATTDSLKLKLEQCAQMARRQQVDAARAAMQAAQAQKKIH
jgi:hypothetical protein